MESCTFFSAHICIHSLGLSQLFFILCNLSIKSSDIAHISLSKDLISMLHLCNEPLECAGYLLGLGHHGYEHMGQSIIHLHLHNLWIDHNEA